MQILVLQNPIITTLRRDLNVAHWILQNDAVSDKLRILHQPMQLRTAASTKISKHAYLVDVISLLEISIFTFAAFIPNIFYEYKAKQNLLYISFRYESTRSKGFVFSFYMYVSICFTSLYSD